MTTGERLRSFYEFDEEVVGRVSAVAQEQNQHSFKELADLYGVSDGAERVAYDGSKRVLEFLHLRPLMDYDTSVANVLYTPLAIPADENMAMRAFRLFGADPTKQLLVVGSPPAVGRRTNVPERNAIKSAWKGDLRLVVESSLDHLSKMDIEQTTFLGYSLGSHLAAEATSYAAKYGIESRQGVWMEPPSVVKQPLRKLLKDFMRSGEVLQEYVDRTDSPPLHEARQLADTGFVRYAGGLLRLSNIAIAHGLSRGTFINRIEDALEFQPELRTTIAWGGKSEIVHDAELTHEVDYLQELYGHHRIYQLRVENMHHAGGDDIDLHAAIVLHALKQQRAAN